MFTKRFVWISSYFSQYHNKTCLDALPVTSNVKFKLGAINWTIVKMLKISSVEYFCLITYSKRYHVWIIHLLGTNVVVIH